VGGWRRRAATGDGRCMRGGARRARVPAAAAAWPLRGWRVFLFVAARARLGPAPELLACQLRRGVCAGCCRRAGLARGMPRCGAGPAEAGQPPSCRRRAAEAVILRSRQSRAREARAACGLPPVCCRLCAGAAALVCHPGRAGARPRASRCIMEALPPCRAVSSAPAAAHSAPVGDWGALWGSGVPIGPSKGPSHTVTHKIRCAAHKAPRAAPPRHPLS
jgi:hypothetical protein